VGIRDASQDGVTPAAAALALTLATAVPGAQQVAQPAPRITASSSASELTIGGKLTVAGVVTIDGHGVSGAALALQEDPYPSHGYETVARARTAADGSFSFAALRPDRNIRLRVIADAPPAAVSRELTVFVDPAVAMSARRLGPGETRMSLRIRHTPASGSQAASALWFTAPRGTSLFRLAAVTETRELAPGVTYASVVVDPPARRFLYRVCLNPAWERAMGPPSTHGRCPRHDFKLPAHAR
jgi:hypothetical protein